MTDASDVGGPLDGYRIVELALEIQGPLAGQTLSELGAEVIKVEARGSGDSARNVTLAKLADVGPEMADFRHYFYAFNRGKRSIALDLKTEDGRAVLMRLLEGADVLLSNFRLGVLDRLGFGFEALAGRFPRLVYAVASGWGPHGPRSHLPSRDMLAQAASGLMAKTGLDSDPPLPTGTNIGDYSGGHMLVTAILAALLQRARTGRGQRVDVSLYGALLALQPWEIFQTGLSGREPPRAGHAHPHMAGAWGAFQTADGWLVLASIHDAVWPRFCAIIGRPDLAADARWTGRARNVKGEDFRRLIEHAFIGRTTAEWMAELGPAGVWAAAAATWGEVLDDRQAIDSGYIISVEHPDHGLLKLVGSPIGFSGATLRAATTAPALGADTDAILHELGYAETEITRLRGSGAI